MNVGTNLDVVRQQTPPASGHNATAPSTTGRVAVSWRGKKTGDPAAAESGRRERGEEKTHADGRGIDCLAHRLDDSHV